MARPHKGLRSSSWFWTLVVGLTGAQSGGRDLDLTGSLVRLEGRRSASSAEVCSEQVRALSPRGTGAGTIASVVGLLFFIHCDQLGGEMARCWI